MKRTVDEFEHKCLLLSEVIKKNKDGLVEILTDYEPYNVVINEISSAIRALDNIVKKEGEYLSWQEFTISVFFPINLPLYSLILFVIAPSIFSNKIYVRTPILARWIVERILGLLKIGEDFPEIEIVNFERAVFIEKCAKKSNVIIFVGKYQNAVDVMRKCPAETLILHNGSGINPIIIAEDANIDFSVKKTIRARIFNSGQDCAGPNVIFLNKKIADKFLEKIISKLNRVKIGDYKDSEVLVGKVIDQEHLLYLGKILGKHRDDIVFGGDVDFKRSIVYPTIIVKRKEIQKTFPEFFAPIFYINVYDDEENLLDFFNSSHYLNSAMYVSVFGNPTFMDNLKKSIILKEKIVLDIDEGNCEFGGHGQEASFVGINKKIISKPLLISREIDNYVIKKIYERS